MAEPNVFATAEQLIGQVIGKYWWVAVLIVLAWYLRWYSVARDTMSNGKESAIGALFATAKHMLFSGKRALMVGVTVVLGAAMGLGWIFQILPTIAAGIGMGDPVVWAATVAGFVAAGAGLDISWATPRTTIGAFAMTFLGLIAVKLIADWSSAMADDMGDDEEEEDEGSYDGGSDWTPSGFP